MIHLISLLVSGIAVLGVLAIIAKGIKVETKIDQSVLDRIRKGGR